MNFFNDNWLLTKCEVRFRIILLKPKISWEFFEIKVNLKEGVLEKKKKPPLPRKLSIPP